MILKAELIIHYINLIYRIYHLLYYSIFLSGNTNYASNLATYDYVLILILAYHIGMPIFTGFQ